MSITYLPTLALSHQGTKIVTDFICNSWPLSCLNQYRLKDGQKIQLKRTGQDDTGSIVEILSGLGPDSCYLRFGQKELSPEKMQRMADKIAEESNTVGEGWIAYAEQADGQVKPAGMARYVELPDGRAEVAFTVVDRYQGLGLGKILWEKVSQSAKRAKLDQLVAHVNPKNQRMQSLVHNAGGQVSTDYASQTLTMTINICQNPFQKRLQFYIPSV